ncbi:hypothetical protein FEM48_Zijuj06G0037200 [Ziziphus jujuba var. spinosa]|uniref:Bulb-type lectin domain-containing protein n=1 Tax=Ziziphus jujuba var. spinosa TaxID=714518 RepID=A0A978V6Z2_ZIZJJ|nr:hypothetical protein FEM48_Zijuj06G0037200 [Ziziphus jujuba var. spinosa]
MAVCLLFLLLVFRFFPFTSSTISSLSKGKSLSVENANHVLSSPNGIFAAGFYPVGQNAYCFAVWFNMKSYDGSLTVVWIANRDQPVNGKRSKLSLLKSDNLILTDAGQLPVWATSTSSNSSLRLQLHNSGNLVLHNFEGRSLPLWQSFDSPTHTLLPGQPLSRYIKLVSSRSKTNVSSGYYKLFFDDDNVLRLLFDGPQTSSFYWPDPWMLAEDAGRSRYNDTRIAVFDSRGYFRSSDRVEFTSFDFVLMDAKRFGQYLGKPCQNHVGFTMRVDLTAYAPMILLLVENVLVLLGFQYKFMEDEVTYNCYPKRQFRNGHRSPNFVGTIYVKLPKSAGASSYNNSFNEFKLDCSSSIITEQLDRDYQEKQTTVASKDLLWIACAIGLIEAIRRNPAISLHAVSSEGEAELPEQGRLVTWVRERMKGSLGISEIVDSLTNDTYDRRRIEILIEVALQCVEDDRDARPTMTQVVELLLRGTDQ